MIDARTNVEDWTNEGYFFVLKFVRSYFIFGVGWEIITMNTVNDLGLKFDT